MSSYEGFPDGYAVGCLILGFLLSAALLVWASLSEVLFLVWERRHYRSLKHVFHLVAIPTIASTFFFI